MTVWFSEDGFTAFSTGPDCKRGMDCCCGTCNFIKLGANCTLDCCKCVPRWLCVVFYPDPDPYQELPTYQTILTYEGTWTGGLDGIDLEGDNDDIYVQLTLPDDDPYKRCFYKLLIPARGIEITEEIEGGGMPCQDVTLYGDNRITCQNPRFTLENFELNGLNGTLVIERKMLQTVPFTSPVFNPETDLITTDVEPCGYCTEWCNTICLEWTSGGQRRKDEFDFGFTEGLVRFYGHTFADGQSAFITPMEDEDGKCFLRINHRDIEDFPDVYIPNGMCNLGMIIEATDTYDTSRTVSISCNRCSCWDYICETCRCVCPVLCVVSIEGSSFSDIDRQELIWDRTKLRWGTDEKWVAVRANPETGKCEFISSAWINTNYNEMDYDPDVSNIDAQCGGEMSYFIARELSDAVIDGNYRLEWGQCRQCQPDCFGPLICAECCTDCEDPVLPDTLYFDLVGRPVASGEEPGPYAVRCIEIYDLPLVHMEPLFAERHRWEGRHIISCGCPQDSETQDPNPDNYFIHIVITCSGETWTIDVSISRPEGSIGNDQTTNTGIDTVSFSCSPIAWTGALELGGLINAALCCCDLSLTMDFAVSE